MTRMALGQKAGVSDATVGYLEAKQRTPTVDTIARLATALSVSVAWLAYDLGEQSDDGQPANCDGMGARLLATRSACGYTKIALARLTMLNPGSIAKIESGGMTGVDTIEWLASVLRVSPAWLA
jgi:transcriptional regulator with XRE-family HTH domain